MEDGNARDLKLQDDKCLKTKIGIKDSMAMR